MDNELKQVCMLDLIINILKHVMLIILQKVDNEEMNSVESFSAAQNTQEDPGNQGNFHNFHMQFNTCKYCDTRTVNFPKISKNH